MLGRWTVSFNDLWWPDLWPDQNSDRSDFYLIFDTLSNAAFPVSLRGPRPPELEGGCLNTPPSRAWKSRTPSGARVNLRECSVGMTPLYSFCSHLSSICKEKYNCQVVQFINGGDAITLQPQHFNALLSCPYVVAQLVPTLDPKQAELDADVNSADPGAEK